ncbi:sugar ABC transporter ATP-binding protein [Leucobacter weissii]|uniref:Sugar ABC transporter ATP-binding protein n=1 Tax=Leucobacter weissii TaxID=1983706 RepID=A0A939S7C3_9MICO|nr:sugar ABC transporter ATP-binding protein [Leucobacter weissii]MBO1900836.1 sugar ABC transporter ATP-binding protein [Leucobacter weissii]
MQTPPAQESALVVSGLAKDYPGVRALADVSLSLAAGTVLAVVGENGAGKSTLMKSVAGAIRPTAGTIEVLGSPLFGGSPRAAEEAGVAMIYQELTLAPEMSAEENVFLGHAPSRFGVIRRREMRLRYDEVSRRVGGGIRPDTRAGRLSTASQQLLEIMRAIAHGRRLVIMDEPTASLGPGEIERLHGIIRELKADGCAILYVSHDLDAVLDVSDEVLVMREGRTVAHDRTENWRKDTLVTAMLGHVPDIPRRDHTARTETRTAVEIEDLRAPGVDVPHLAIGAGEVVGIAGLVGSGRTRMLRSIAGADPVRSGRLEIDGAVVAWPKSTARAWRTGIALAPEDRKRQGLVLHRESAWNVAVGAFGTVRRRGAITPQSIRLWAAPFTERVAFKTARLKAPAGTLSGGNQQKLLLARLLSRPLRLMLLDEPTRGMDIGAKSEVFAAMRAFADTGASVLWSSSELQEVLDHSDRIVVVNGGRMVAEFPAGTSMQEVLSASFAAAPTRTDPKNQTEEIRP